MSKTPKKTPAGSPEGDPKQSINEILENCDAARAGLAAVQLQIQAKYNDLLDGGYDRDLTKDEVAQLATLNNAMGAIYAEDSELALMTVRALNESAEVTRLNRTLTAINGDLKSKLGKATNVAKQLSGIADLLKTLATIVNGLAGLAGMLG